MSNVRTGVSYSGNPVYKNMNRERGRVVRFPGQPYLRRHGTNFTVCNEHGWIACDELGNPWAFCRRYEGEAYLNQHTPEFWVDTQGTKP